MLGVVRAARGSRVEGIGVTARLQTRKNPQAALDVERFSALEAELGEAIGSFTRDESGVFTGTIRTTN